MSNSFVSLIFILFMFTIVFVSWRWENKRSYRLIEQWAYMNRYKLLRADRQFLEFLSPFWLAGKGQTVYRFEVKDYHGQCYKGYALCGGRYLGLWSNRIEIKWDNLPVEKGKHELEKPKNDFKKKKRHEQPVLHRW
jgi:hypothetical protein